MFLRLCVIPVFKRAHFTHACLGVRSSHAPRRLHHVAADTESREKAKTLFVLCKHDLQEMVCVKQEVIRANYSALIIVKNSTVEALPL